MVFIQLKRTKMLQLKNEIYTGAKGRKSVYDLSIPDIFNGKIVLFIHGYKGFKDWGSWFLMEKQFVENGFGFCKFNLSHNGGTTDNPIDFPDLEAFANNCFSYQYEDIQTLIATLNEKYSSAKIILIGHSRGGALALLSGRNTKVCSVITLASVCSFAKRFEKPKELMDNWKKDGVRFELNSRTQQQMPLNYLQYEDFLEHQDMLNVENACRHLHKPCLHFHGKNDTSILVDEAIQIASWTQSPLYIIEEADHTFNSKHPWKSEELSTSLQFIMDKTLDFLKSIE